MFIQEQIIKTKKNFFRRKAYKRKAYSIESIEKFQIKHFLPLDKTSINPFNNINLDKWKTLYDGALPCLITLFPKIPNFANFKRRQPNPSSDIKCYRYPSKDQYRSINKVEMNIIRTAKKIMVNMYAHVDICFIYRMGKYHPIHVVRIEDGTEIYNYEISISS